MTPRLRLGYPTRLLEGPFREKIRQAAGLRAQGVQLDLRHELRPGELSETGLRQFGHLLDEQGLALAPAVFPLRRAIADRDGLEERVAAVTAALRFAGDLKAGVLIVRPGAVPGADSKDRPLLLEVLNDLARAGDHVGVTLTLTTGREPVESLTEVLGAITAGPIGVNIDPAAAVMAGRDPAAGIRALHSYLRHVRVRDGLQESDGAGIEVPVGRGEVEWESVLAALAEADYGGWLTPDRTTGEDPAKDAANALSYLRNVMPF